MTTPAIAALGERVEYQRRLPRPEMRRAIRCSNGLSTLDLAQALGVSRQAVSRWERGERTPRGRQLRDYVELLAYLDGLSRGAA